MDKRIIVGGALIVALIGVVAYLNIGSPWALLPDPQRLAGPALYKAATTKEVQASSSYYIQKGERINTGSLTKDFGDTLTENQTCLSKGDFEADDRFEYSTSTYNDQRAVTLYFTSKEGAWIKFGAYCANGQSLLSFVTQNGGNSNWLNTPECQQTLQNYPPIKLPVWWLFGGHEEDY